MAGTNHVPPPDSALAPNLAPGRAFYFHDDTDADQEHAAPIAPAVIDFAKPNLTRLALASQLFMAFLAAGNDEATAHSLADAQALLMIP